MATPKKPAAKKPAAKRTPAKKTTRKSTPRKKNLVPSGTLTADATVERAEEQKPTRYFLRNLTGAQVGIRLARQENERRRTDLKPRGFRGDMVPLQPDDLFDPAVTSNVELGVVEIITEAEAQAAATKQLTNQQAVHPALDVIRNPLGERYEAGQVKGVVETDEIVVASLEDGQVQFDRSAKGANIRRTIGGNPAIVSDGFADAAQARDKAARDAKNREGPAAGLGGLAVTIAPTQHT